MSLFDNLKSGVLPDYAIKALIENQQILNGNVSRIQPSSLDVLPDLNRIYEIDEFYPPRKGEKIETIITDLCNQRVARQIKGHLILKKKKRYLVPLLEQLQGVHFYARNNPKSSPGRIFQHTRLLTDESQAYDEIYPYHQPGKQWLLLSPKSFNVTLSEDEPVCQLRFFKGSHRLSQKDLDQEMLVRPFISAPETTPLFQEEIEIPVVGSAIGSHVLSIDMRSDIVAYKTKNTDEPIDISCRSLDWKKYFEVIYRDQLKQDKLILDIGEGYLFGSLERIRLPGNIAGEVSAYGEKYGELRIHFAGYIDNGFGQNDSRHGNSITFEVIAHEKGVGVRHGQQIGEIQYEYMAGKSTKLYEGNYILQPSGPQLPKYFKK